jgi:DNA invertase Pin-like site-specific DNA recombinase
LKVALYARVSTGSQSPENQIAELKEVGERLGWQIVEVFVDHGISGAKGRDQRPAFDRLLKGISRKDFSLVATWSVCRLGRSLQDLVGFLSELHARGVGLFLLKQGLDTSSPAGRAMFGMLGIFAEFERAMIQDRIRAGLARVRAEGKTRLGRPPLPEATLARIREELLAGHGIHKTAAVVGVGIGSVQRVRAELRAAS